MSAEPASLFTQASLDGRTRAAVIRRHDLTPEVVASIEDSARSLGLSFVDAAVRLGIVCQADVEAALGSEQRIAVVQRKRVVPHRSLTILRDPFDPHSEAVRALRTELILRRDSHTHANLVALLSPCAGEGRSQLAAELAIAFSQLGQPTLLIDADLRRPKQHVLFNADNAHGLSDAISQALTPALNPVEGLPELSVLTSGPIPPNPLELLCDGRFEKLVDEWRKRFAYIVFDTPPVDKYADGLAVATLAARALTVYRAAHTPYAETRNLLRRLTATHSNILGAVVNHF